MPKFYTGVGSRNTPADILSFMMEIAKYLSEKNYILRTGNAEGADAAFKSGSKKSHVFYPEHTNTEAIEIAKSFHPAWDKMSDYAKKLHGRNSFQVLGTTLTKPSKFLICWTPDGCISHEERTIKTGGTGTAISIASKFGVQIYNLQLTSHYDKLKYLLDTVRQKEMV